MNHLEKLISVIQETKTYLGREENDFSWSSWNDKDHALSEIDSILDQLEHGFVPDLEVLFAPPGPIQEVSLSSGWSHEYLRLAERFDEAYQEVKNQP